jgi:hypothetical protein
VIFVSFAVKAFRELRGEGFVLAQSAIPFNATDRVNYGNPSGNQAVSKAFTAKDAEVTEIKFYSS